MRCYDLGYIPFESTNGENFVKLYGPPFLSRFFSQTQNPSKLVKLNLETTLGELKLVELR